MRWELFLSRKIKIIHISSADQNSSDLHGLSCFIFDRLISTDSIDRFGSKAVVSKMTIFETANGQKPSCGWLPMTCPSPAVPS